MPTYRVRIGTQDQRIEERTVTAANAAALADVIRASGAYLIEARRVFAWADVLAGAPPADEIALALGQLATMTKSGVSLPDAFRAVATGIADESLAAALRASADRLVSGATLAAALEASPDVFDPLLVASVRAAPDPAAVQLAFARRAEAIALREELSRSVRSAAAYPVFLLGLAGLVLSFLVLHVVPSIGRLYEESGTALPGITRATLAVTAFLRANAGWLALLAISGFVVATIANRTERGGRAIEAILGRVPVVGAVWVAHPWIGWALTIADALSAGVALPTALRMASAVVVRPRLAAALVRVTDDVERGTDLGAALGKTRLTCPPLLSSALSLPAKGVDLAELLRGAARAESSRMSWALTRLTRSVEPVLMVAVGLVIGAIVVSLYLPILSLVETL